ncbi:MAG: hypothetical protein ACRDOI_07245 [Trebonia sp.]
MTIPRVSPDIEKPFRKALGHAIRNEHEEMREVLLRLTDEQIVSCLGLCAIVSGYVAIDVCGRQWPNEANLHVIAEATTKSAFAREFGLKAQDSYSYVKRVALQAEPLDKVFPTPEDAGTLSFVVTGHLLVAFGPAAEEWWEYLNKIEAAYETALAADLDLLPALILRARRLTSPETPNAAES